MTGYFNGRQYCTPFAGAGYLAATAQPSYYLGGFASLLMIAGGSRPAGETGNDDVLR